MEEVTVSLTYLSSPLWLSLAFAGCAVAAVLSYVRFFKRGSRVFVAFLSFLRFCALAAALLVLLRPVIRYDTIVKQEKRLVLLVDTSKSMAIADSVAGTRRIDTAKTLAGTVLQRELEKAFIVETFGFDTDIDRLGDAIKAGGERTDIGKALLGASDGTVPLACSVLLSDGNDTESEHITAGRTPVWTVPLGSGFGVWNLAVRQVQVEHVVLLNNKTAVTASCEVTGDVPVREVNAHLVLGGRRLAEKTVKLEKGSRTVHFSFIPRSAGELTGKVVFETVEGEVFPDDNSRHFVCTVVQDRLPVLMYEASPRWESKFIMQSLGMDRNLKLVSVLRTSDAKIMVKGRSPVALEGGLPGTLEAMKAFSVIVLGDVTASDFLPQQGGLLRSYVSEGGSLIILGGRRNLSGALQGMQLGPVLPATAEGPLKRDPVRVKVADPRHPAVRGLLPLFLSLDGGKGAPLQGVLPLGGLSPGARTLLAVQRGDQKTLMPLLVVQRYGKGKVAVFGSNATWRWMMQYAGSGGRTLHQRFWGQLLRWAASVEQADEEKKASLLIAKRVVNAGEEVTVSFSETPGRKTMVTVAGPKGTEAFAAGGDGSGAPVTFRPEVPGDYTVSCRLSGGEESRTVFVEPDPAERETLEPAADRLYDIADRTGGGLVRLNEINTLPRRIVRSFPGVLQEVEETPEKNPLLFIIFCSCLCLEWFLRRKMLTV